MAHGFRSASGGLGGFRLDSPSISFNPKTLVVILVYMSLIYTCVSVFSVGMSDSQSIDIYLDGWKTASVDTVVESDSFVGGINDSNAFNQTINSVEDVDIWTMISGAFEAIGKTFTFIFSFLTFGTIFSSSVVGAFPVWLSWIPFILTFPVWVYIMICSLPIMVALINIVLRIVDIIVPDWL